MTLPAHLQQALDDARRRAAVGVDDARGRLRALQSAPPCLFEHLVTLATNFHE